MRFLPADLSFRASRNEMLGDAKVVAELEDECQQGLLEESVGAITIRWQIDG